MRIFIRFNREDKKRMKQAARQQGLTLNAYIKQAVIETIEDKLDHIVAEQALQDHKLNPVTYSLDEVAEILELKS